MATRKNVTVAITSIDGGDKVRLTFPGGESVERDMGAWRQKLDAMSKEELLDCYMAIKCEDAGVNAQTALFTALKVLLDGNYKIGL